jgi:hypothetical protein
LENLQKMLSNKKGQIGETITWAIATIVLVVILIIFIYASVALSKVKTLKTEIKANSADTVNWINAKTQMAYSVSSANKNKIQIWISQGGG